MKPDMFMVLAALAAGEEEALGILQRLRQAPGGGAPTVPTLYRRLAEAEHSGWLEVVRAEGEAARGRPPQIYRLTRAGRGAVRTEAARWRAVAALVQGGTEP